MFYTSAFQFYLKNGQKKKRRWYLSEEKTEEKQNSAAIMISVVGKGKFLRWSWSDKGKRSNKHWKKENFWKDLMNLIETNHQINMTSDHSVLGETFH